eukprot:8632607-Alexandrium_andersonii.AAC.1
MSGGHGLSRAGRSSAVRGDNGLSMTGVAILRRADCITRMRDGHGHSRARTITRAAYPGAHGS